MSGILLGFDTSTEAVGIGVAREDASGMSTLVSAAVPARRRANTILLELTVKSLEESGVALGDVTAVIVGCGPGSFTGVRIGVAAAKGLAQGLGVPLIGVSTAEAVAWNAALSGHEGVVGVLGDAMRGEVYPALFLCSDGGLRRLSADRVAKPDDVASHWADEGGSGILLMGNGLGKYRDTFASALTDRAEFAPEESWYPTGAGLFAAYARSSRAGELGSGDPATVLPIYTRLSDAEENERARDGADAGLPPRNGVAGDSRGAGGDT